MFRERSKFLPSIPKTLEEFGIAAKDYDRTKHIYRGTVLAADGSVHVIFASDEGLSLLDKSTEIFADGTFKARKLF